MHALIIANRQAGQGGRIEEAAAAVAAAGLESPTRYVEPQDLHGDIQAAGAGFERVIVAGGDGTVATAVGALAHGRAELAILPMGTHNNFARSLGIPTDIGEAARLAATGQAQPVDVGRADDAYFANAVTIGLSSRIAKATPSGLKRLLGPIAYALVGLRVLVRARPFTCTLTTDEGTWTVRTHQLVVANGRRLGAAVAAPEATAEDGVLHVTSLGRGTRRSLLGALRDFQRGAQGGRDDSVLLRTREVLVEADPPQRIDMDGEVAQWTPTRLRVEPEALQVVVPAGRPEA